MLYAFALRGQIGEDSMVFYTAARAWITGDGPQIYNGYWLTDQINARFVGWLATPIKLHPWIYPPSFLLIVLPLAVLPFAAALLLAQGVGLALIAVASCAQVAARRWMLASLLLSPATAVNVLLGQNAFLTGALLIGGAGSLRRFPVVSGVLLGLLTYKPQFCLMVPVVLLAGQHWATAITALLTAVALVLTSAALFGLKLWATWIDLVTGQGSLSYDWSHEARLNGMSVYACASWLGIPPDAVSLMQLLAVLIAATAVYAAYRRVIPDELRLAVLLAATFVAAPHSANYDAVLLLVAATLLIGKRSSDSSQNRTELVLACALWLCPLFNPPSVFTVGAFTPLLVFGFIATLLRRSRSIGKG
ncbi:MAG: glycosyltransferase family 87 protein [Janthinobacterium lividum]